MTFVRNTWYVAAWSHEIGAAFVVRRLLGVQILLYRAEGGGIIALEDACPHRRLPLSMGYRIGDTVQCGYHGLTFDRTGACTAAPTQDRIPRNARVRAWPAVERYGLVWIWTGDADRADPALIVDIPHYGDAGWGRTEGGDMGLACSYLLVMENLLDPSHVAWVHRSSFAGPGTDGGGLTLVEGDDGVVVSRWIMDAPPPPYYTRLVPFQGNADRLQHYECVVPSVAINKSVYTPAGTGGPGSAPVPETYINVSYNFLTPVDARSCHYFWFQHRNTDPDDADVSTYMNNGARMAFEEDRAVLEAVQKGLDNAPGRTIDLGLDAGAIRFRRLLEKRIAAEAADQSRP